MTLDCAKKYRIKFNALIINKVPNNSIVSEKYFIDKFKAFSEIVIFSFYSKIWKFK